MGDAANQKLDLVQKQCRACEGDVKPFSEEEAQSYLKQVPDWEILEGKVTRRFRFKNYYETAAFVNAVVWVAHSQNHHPDICFGYKECKVSFYTHSINGLSENDFICAARIDHLF